MSADERDHGGARAADDGTRHTEPDGTDGVPDAGADEHAVDRHAVDRHDDDQHDDHHHDDPADGSAPAGPLLAAVAQAAIVPGWSARRRRPVLAVALAVLGVAAPVAMGAYVLVAGRSWVALSVDTGFLAWAAAVLVAALVGRLAAIAEVWWAYRGTPRRSRDRWAIPVAVVVCVPLALGAGQVLEARHDLAPVFTPVAADRPLFDPADPIDPPTTTRSVTTTSERPPVTVRVVPLGPGATNTTTSTSSTTTLPPKPARPRAGVDPQVVAEVRTILLLGGDAGPGRSGLRTDTMMLFCIHPPSGRAALISIPRDLRRMLFPPGSELERRYPYGWTDLANAIYPIVSANRSLRAAYEVADVRPGVVALAQSVGYSFDVPIDDYVLVDMQGFIELIDAIGGVTVNVPKAVPMPGNVPGAPTQYPDTIGPGVIAMDGSTALGYVRSRKGDSDYQRTRRQRDLLASLATQIDLAEVIASFPSVAAALGGTLRTSLTPDELANTLAVIGGETAIVESVGLVPPLVNVKRPDYQRLAEIVGAVRVALATGTPSGY